MGRLEDLAGLVSARYQQGIPPTDLMCDYHLSSRDVVRTLVIGYNRGMLTDQALKPLVREEKNPPFPEKMDARLNALLPAFSSEPKLTGFLCLDDTLQTAYDVRTNLLNPLQERGVSLPSGSSFMHSFGHDLCEAGLVRMVVLGQGLGLNEHYFMRTPAGRNIGQPIGVGLLDLVVAQERSLAQLGATQSSTDHKGPYTRLKILEEIARGTRTPRQLMGKVDISAGSVLAYHLNALKNFGYVARRNGSIYPANGETFLLDCLARMQVLLTRPKELRKQRMAVPSDPAYLVDRFAKAMKVYHEFQSVRSGSSATT